jgi:hypothetical protein
VTEVVQLALNIARNCRWPVFPCGDDKAPCISKREGGNGFHDASLEPAQIKRLFAHPRASLIGIPTGEISGIDVLDIDTKHDMASKWWEVASKSVPPTRIYRTRSGGFHVYFQHTGGISNTQSKLAYGVDTRGDGGYIVYWYAAGFECIDHTAPAPWPTWLRDCVQWQPAKVELPGKVHAPEYADKAIEAVLRQIEAAREGERNRLLFWAGTKLAERIHLGQITKTEAQALLLARALSAGLPRIEASRTVASALKAA